MFKQNYSRSSVRLKCRYKPVSFANLIIVICALRPAIINNTILIWMLNWLAILNHTCIHPLLKIRRWLYKMSIHEPCQAHCRNDLRIRFYRRTRVHTYRMELVKVVTEIYLHALLSIETCANFYQPKSDWAFSYAKRAYLSLQYYLS